MSVPKSSNIRREDSSQNQKSWVSHFLLAGYKWVGRKKNEMEASGGVPSQLCLVWWLSPARGTALPEPQPWGGWGLGVSWGKCARICWKEEQMPMVTGWPTSLLPSSERDSGLVNAKAKQKWWANSHSKMSAEFCATVLWEIGLREMYDSSVRGI